MTRLTLAWRLAKRELRGGIRGFRVLLACLIVGVGAIAAVGSATDAITSGLEENGQRLLGGDVELRLTHRMATETEREWLEQNTAALSEIVTFRGMVGTPDGERALAQVKAVDDAYPLSGDLLLKSGATLHDALSIRGNSFGAVAEQALLDRLGLRTGVRLRLGDSEVELRDVIEEEPDRQAAGLQLGPRLMVARAGLQGSGLLQPGSLYYSEYRLLLKAGETAQGFRARLEAALPDAGWRWRDLRDPAPGISGTVERIGTFLVLVGLAALAVGGVGILAATRAYLDGKTETIGTLKALGAEGGLIVATYLMQIGVLAVAGILGGLALGAAIPLALSDRLAQALPVPPAFGIYPGALGEAALYGALTVLLFALWPLAQARETPASVLFREVADGARGWPRPAYLAATALTLALLAGAAIRFSGNWMLGASFLGALAVALAAFFLAAMAIRRVARWLGRRRSVVRGRPSLRIALSSIASPGGETSGVMLSLGLGLTLLSAIGQIDANLRSLVTQDISEEAPAFFFLDIPAPQRDAFAETAAAQPSVSSVETAPMLRGRITHINGEIARPENVAPEARWVLRGDRGLTYAETPPEGAVLTDGAWWRADYTGEPLVSFIDEEGRQLGLAIGDTITVNVLGRDLTARVASFREVEWRRMGINFTMIFNPASLRAAPHSHIATVYAEEGSEGALTRLLAVDFPSAVAIPVREVIARTNVLLGDLANAVRGASLATLISGLIVLIGAIAAGQRRMIYEAAVMKTVGATRPMLVRVFFARYLVLGGIAATIAILLGLLAGWLVVSFVFETGFEPDIATAAIIAILGVSATLGAGALFSWRSLSARPARILRARG